MQFQSELSSSIEDAFAYLLCPSSLQRLLPPWKKIKILSQVGLNEEKQQVLLSLGFTKWLLERSANDEKHEIREIQLKGPFKKWEHIRKLESQDSSSCLLQDLVDFVPRFYFKKNIVQKLSKVFTWQQALIARDLWVKSQYAEKPLRILLSGSSGFVGNSLLHFLRCLGHDVVRLVRKGTSSDSINWDPSTSEANIDDFEGFDAVIHLAGENIASGLWTKKKKEAIFVSRVRDTWVLSQVLARTSHPPKTFISASAIGFFGNRDDELLTEESTQGIGFLADTVAKWEHASHSLESKGIRVVQARFGAVISPSGGMMKSLLPIYKLGLGGKMGSGKQFVSWIAIDDLLGAFYHVLHNANVKGAVHFTSPYPIRQEEFANTWAAVFNKKANLPMPDFFLRLALGEMAEELLLSSQKAIPQKLLDTGYLFAFPQLKEAIQFWY